MMYAADLEISGLTSGSKILFNCAMGQARATKGPAAQTEGRPNAAPSVQTASARPRLGSRTVNSVKSPTSLSTVMVPPCCCVTIS
jgi:hypothetical protein